MQINLTLDDDLTAEPGELLTSNVMNRANISSLCECGFVILITEIPSPHCCVTGNQ